MKIELTIMLSPEYLDANIEKHILEKTIQKYKHTTLKDIGYIIDIHSLINIIDMSIHVQTHENIIKALFEAEIFLPKIGKIITQCDIHMLFIHGIFIKYHNIDILVPSSTLNEYIFNQDKQCFTHKTHKTTISKQSTINIKLTNIRYSDNEFSCLAEIM